MSETHRVLVLYTGGTIGMRAGPRGFEPTDDLGHVIEGLPQLHERGQPRFTTPMSAEGVRVRYNLTSLDPPRDSADLGLEDWARFAKTIALAYESYEAFVVLHGTDTMAYTASALSFMLEGLTKPVVLTGAQIPLAGTRTDALSNFLGALGIAGVHAIPEVGLYFHHKLLRGNRTTKRDAWGLDAFESPNFPPLVEVGIDAKVHWESVLPPAEGPFRAHTEMSPHVAALRFFPGINAETFQNFLLNPLRGLVIETFGSGNVPHRNKELLRVLGEASDRGVVILNVTQCQRGAVGDEYAAGRVLREVGVVGCHDMTAEAALTKLSYLLGKGLPPEEVRRLSAIPLRGELTLPEHRPRASYR